MRLRWRDHGRWVRVQDRPGVLLLIAVCMATLTVYAAYRALHLPAGGAGDRLIGVLAPFWFGLIAALALVRLLCLLRRRQVGEHHLGEHDEPDRR